MKIYLNSLDCYKNASPKFKEHKLYNPDRCFDLSKLPNTNVKSEIKEFIQERGKILSPLSIASELYPFNLFCSFLNDEFCSISSMLTVSENTMIQCAKKWLLKNGRNITQIRHATETGKEKITDSELVKYIRHIYRFLLPENKTFNYSADRWYLDNVPFDIRRNPVKAVKSISFEKISQPVMRDEIKSVMKIHLSDVSLGTVCAEITAVNRFCQYMFSKYPEVESLQDIDRELIENYLIYINTEAIGRKSYSKELCRLKSVFTTAGKLLDNKELENIFFKDDMGKVPEKLYRVYSDDELKRLNVAIVALDEQIARALFIHQLLGTRISETLTLKQNAIRVDKNGRMFIRIQQIKTGKSYEKAINDDVKKLFDKSCEYTREKYGDREYVFVNDKNPDAPMLYSRIQYQLMAMVQKNDLRDDCGEMFGVGTHIWRHCYGKRLTEMHIDDVTIAKLLGHATTSCLKYYRKIGNQMLAEETRKMRTDMDEILNEILGKWA